MTYEITIEKDLEDKLNKLKHTNFREYTILTRKIDEMKTHATVLLNHKTKFNSFDKPLQKYKWVEVENKLLIFTLDSVKQEIHLCEYLAKNEVYK